MSAGRERDAYFRGKVAIVTGGASGIGREICRYLAARSATVHVADLDVQRGMEIAAELNGMRPDSASFHPVDVASEEQVRSLVASVTAFEGKLDLMFNNAGIGTDGEFADLTMDDWRRMANVNFWGVVYGTDAAFRYMKDRGSGQIVNVSSLAGLIPGGLMTSYVATKHAVTGLTLGLRPEGRVYGVRVNLLCPGFLETEIHDHSRKVTDYLREEPSRGKKSPFPTAAKVIGQMMRGVERDRAIIVAPRLHKVFWWMYRLVPASVPLMWEKIIRHLKKEWSKRAAASAS
jgi:NAD(P)-dependent dehydrogenase (short-subunit alcohol dehydrogenase family)